MLLSQVRDFFTGKLDILEKIERLIQAGGNQIVSPRREGSDKQFERCAGVITRFDITCPHRQFIQIGLEAGIVGVGSHAMSAAIMPFASSPALHGRHGHLSQSP